MLYTNNMPDGLTQNTIEQSIQPIQPEVKPAGTFTRNMAKSLAESGIDSRVLPVQGNEFLKDVIMLPHPERDTTEKLVRVYRGVGQTDADILNQTPYAMRTLGDKPHTVATVEDVREEITALSHLPSYDNLLKYVQKMKPFLSEHDQNHMSTSVTRAEEAILNAESLRSYLVYEQHAHAGGGVDTDITPYISASFDSREAAGYAIEAVMVIDLPVSELEDNFGLNGETQIKDVLDPKYITAIIPRNRSLTREVSEEVLQGEINNAIQTVSANSDSPVLDENETVNERAKAAVKTRISDESQLAVDLQAVRLKRSQELRSKYSKLGIDFTGIEERATESGNNLYLQVKQEIYDHLARQYLELTGGKIPIERRKYGKNMESINRDGVNDDMLEEMRIRVGLEETTRTRLAA